MTRSAGYYNVDDFNDYKRKEGKCLPPVNNVLAAACHVQELFDAKKFTYGFMGGLSMLCLGHKREMPDLHIAYDDKDFERLKAKLESDRRVRLPTGANPLFPFKILVWTGPEHKDQGCSVNANIELDLVPSGAYGTPGAGDLTKSLVSLSLKTASGRQMIFKSLNTQYLLAAMLSYCKARDLSWDPKKDILYLCKNETAEVQRSRGRINIKEVKETFLGTSFFSQLHVQDQRMCYRTLLDTEPPTMVITPLASQPLASLHPKQQEIKHINEIRTPRSQYHNASGQRSNSDGTSDQGTMRNARPQPLDHLQNPRRLTYIQGVQCVISAKPQSVSAAAAAKQARKSMPNLMAPRHTAPTLDASAHGIERIARQQQWHGVPPRVGYAASQISASNPQQGVGKYESSLQSAHLRATDGIKDDNQVILPYRESLTSRTDSTRTDSTGNPVQGIQSQKGSLHLASPEREKVPRQQYLEQKTAPPLGEPHLVGPEGVHGVPATSRHSVQTRAQHQKRLSAPPSHTEPAFFFELDATTPSKPAFIVELPAESIVPPSAKRCSTRGLECPSSRAPVRLLDPRLTSAPLEAGSLPASLVAGALGADGHRRTLSHPGPSDKPTFGFSTNAYRYSSYALPQPANPEASHILPKEATRPAYKAYRPSVSTGQLDRTDSVSSVYSVRHKWDISNDWIASHDSNELAKEYQELLNFEDGYGGN